MDMRKKKCSKEMLTLMAKEFYGSKLNEELLVKAMDMLNTWIQDVDKIEYDMLEDEEPSIIYDRCCD
jgi:hypothetical protein